MILSRSLITGFLLPGRPRLAALVRWLVAVDARYRDACAVARLDDRLLRDIGLERGTLAREVERRSRSAGDGQPRRAPSGQPGTPPVPR